MLKKIILIVGVLIIGYIIYYAVSPLFINVVVDDALPTEVNNEEVEQVSHDETSEEGNVSEKKATGVVGTSGHPASGTARIVEANGENYLRYEDFKTINGPDLFVYLATDLEATEFINLGDLKGTEGNINYQIPEGTDLTKYRYALVWCKQFGVLFNSADLASI